MPRPFALVLAPLFLALLVLGPATRSGRAEDAPGAEPAPAKPSDDARFLPLEAIKPGMRGYGMTVRHGTALERFEVEVIDIARNWLTKQDLILVRCLGDEFADHQIAQGMSGSPIWFDGKLAGALSYTFAWAKHAVGGVTPITDRPNDQRSAARHVAGAEHAFLAGHHVLIDTHVAPLR